MKSNTWQENYKFYNWSACIEDSTKHFGFLTASLVKFQAFSKNHFSVCCVNRWYLLRRCDVFHFCLQSPNRRTSKHLIPSSIPNQIDLTFLKDSHSDRNHFRHICLHLAHILFSCFKHKQYLQQSAEKSIASNITITSLQSQIWLNPHCRMKPQKSNSTLHSLHISNAATYSVPHLVAFSTGFDPATPQSNWIQVKHILVQGLAHCKILLRSWCTQYSAQSQSKLYLFLKAYYLAKAMRRNGLHHFLWKPAVKLTFIALLSFPVSKFLILLEYLYSFKCLIL